MFFQVRSWLKPEIHDIIVELEVIEHGDVSLVRLCHRWENHFSPPTAFHYMYQNFHIIYPQLRNVLSDSMIPLCGIGGGLSQLIYQWDASSARVFTTQEMFFPIKYFRCWFGVTLFPGVNRSSISYHYLQWVGLCLPLRIWFIHPVHWHYKTVMTWYLKTSN